MSIDDFEGKIPRQFLDEYIELTKQVAKLEGWKTHLSGLIEQERTSVVNFERASKEWNSITLMGRVQYSSRNVLYIEQRIVRFMIDMENFEETYNRGDVIMVIGTIKTFHPEDHEENEYWAEINIIPSKIVLISNRDDIDLPKEE